MKHILVASLWKAGTHLATSMAERLKFLSPEFLFTNKAIATDRSFEDKVFVSRNSSLFDVNLTMEEYLETLPSRHPLTPVTVACHCSPTSEHRLSPRQITENFAAVLVLVRSPIEAVYSFFAYMWLLRDDVPKAPSYDEFCLSRLDEIARTTVKVYFDLLAFAAETPNALLIYFDDLVKGDIDFNHIAFCLNCTPEAVRQAHREALACGSPTKISAQDHAKLQLKPETREKIDSTVRRAHARANLWR